MRRGGGTVPAGPAGGTDGAGPGPRGGGQGGGMRAVGARTALLVGLVAAGAHAAAGEARTPDPAPVAGPLSGPHVGEAAPARAAPQAADGIVTFAEGPVRIRAEEGLAELARSLARDERAWAPLPAIGDLRSAVPSPLEVWVVSDLGRIPGRGRGGEAEPWVAGFADPGRNLVALRAGEDGPGDLAALRRTFRHELAHLALSHATGDRAPRWLHEGYAQLVAGDWDWQEAWRLRVSLFREDELLRSLSLDFPAREPDARAAYLLSYTAVHELLRTGGEGALASFFAALREGRDVDAALRKVYHLTEAQFEERWRKSVKGRYGWLYLLSRASLFWVFLTLALLALGWKRWRHQKERWEELRRADEEGSDVTWWQWHQGGEGWRGPGEYGDDEGWRG